MIARVFPRRTKATPTDTLAFCRPPVIADFALGITSVHVSVTFTADIKKAEQLARLWSGVADTSIGGPATGERGEAFTPGVYLKHGYTITSRGCPNRCWFCSVPKREGNQVRELPIQPGWNILDDNLLACSDSHINAVFDMLAEQKERPRFTGGLEAARLRKWHVIRLLQLRPTVMWFAYDTPNDYEPLIEAGKMLRGGGFRVSGHSMGCYVLVGWPADTVADAQRRLIQTVKAGFFPQAMLFRADNYSPSREWRSFARTWANKIIVGAKMRQYLRGPLVQASLLDGAKA